MISATSGQTLQGLMDDVGEFTVLATWHDMSSFAASLTKPQIQSLSQRNDVKHIGWGGERAIFGIASARASVGVNVALNPDILNLTGDLDGNMSSFSSDDVVVCVIDTGVDVGHPAFAADLANGTLQNPRDDFWKDFVGASATPEDVRGHGTPMAGILAGHHRLGIANESDPSSGPYIGVAPGVALYAVRGSNAGEESADLITLIDGIRWCNADWDDPTTPFVTEHLGPDFVDIISGSWGFETNTN